MRTALAIGVLSALVVGFALGLGAWHVWTDHANFHRLLSAIAAQQKAAK